MKWHVPLSVEVIERVQTAKLLGVIFQCNFNFTCHVDAVLKFCSHRLFLLKQLCDQGMSHGHLRTIFSSYSIKQDSSCLSCLGTIPHCSTFPEDEWVFKEIISV